MKALDKFIQKMRIQQAGRYIETDSRVLDIGCADGALFRHLHHRISQGIGIDPGIEQDYEENSYRIIRGNFPQDIPSKDTLFDVITMLAVLEHIPIAEQSALAANIYRHLRPGGKLIVTVPSPLVDKLLAVLKWIGLIDGMSLEEHFGFDVRTVQATFTSSGLKFIKHEFFQLGLNNLFIFEKP